MAERDVFLVVRVKIRTGEHFPIVADIGGMKAVVWSPENGWSGLQMVDVPFADPGTAEQFARQVWGEANGGKS